MSLIISSALSGTLARVRTLKKNKSIRAFTEIESLPQATVPIGQSSFVRGDLRASEMRM